MQFLSLTTNVETAEKLSLALEVIEALVVDQDVFDPILDSPEKAQAIELRLYAEQPEAFQQAQTIALEFGLKATFLELPDQDWVSLSQAGLPTVEAGPWRVHGGHSSPLPGRRKWNLRIDANTAFGTGHHETTRGCLLAFERLRHVSRFKKVLDVGTGTGLLALTAARAGAVTVVASDIDAEAVERANQNALQNGCRLQTQACAGTQSQLIQQQGPYDLVFANILAGPLIELASDLRAQMRPGGLLILAGLISTQRQGVEAAYRSRGLTINFRLQLGDWPILVFRRGS